MVDSRNFKMVTKQISDYWINAIKKQFNEAEITYDNGIFKEAIIKDIYIIRYTAIVNSLQYYKKIAYLEEYKNTCRKEELVCSYGESDKSINVALSDVDKVLKNENIIKQTNWNEKCLHSIYHGCKDEEFYLRVYDVDYVVPSGFSGFKELCFLVDKLDDNQNIQGGKEWLRVSLLGVFYEIVDMPKQTQKQYKQMSLFDFGVE